MQYLFHKSYREIVWGSAHSNTSLRIFFFQKKKNQLNVKINDFKDKFLSAKLIF